MDGWSLVSSVSVLYFQKTSIVQCPKRHEQVGYTGEKIK